MYLLNHFFYQSTMKYVYIILFIHVGSLAYESLKNALAKQTWVKAIKEDFCKFYSIRNVR